MAHRYGLPILVDVGSDAAPRSFVWRGERYYVHVIGQWNLAPRWWDPAQTVARIYYRCQTADQQVFELYHDIVANVWVLDIVQG